MTDPPTSHWLACEHPERPPDKGTHYHLGFLRAGDDKSPCPGCLVACQANVILHGTSPTTLALVAADG